MLFFSVPSSFSSTLTIFIYCYEEPQVLSRMLILLEIAGGYNTNPLAVRGEAISSIYNKALEK